MKHVLVITGLILSLLTAYSFAEILEDPRERGEDYMMEMMNKGPAVEHGKMMGSMKEMSLDMSGLMNDIAGEIKEMKGVSRKISRDKRHRISSIMKDMSNELDMMSEVMEEGEMPEEKMEWMKSRMEDMQKEMKKLGK